jgi:hypothetical protein
VGIAAGLFNSPVNMDAAQQQRILANLGRRSYVSQSGLASVLKELRDAGGQLPNAISRDSIKRARQAEINADTTWGHMIQTLSINLEDPIESCEITYINPIAMLSHAASNCPQFGRLLKKRLDEKPAGPTSRWRIALYSDEVLPGNQLKHDNKRKLQAVYWSFMELGAMELSCECLWFVLTTVRSCTVARIEGGMSSLLKVMLEPFFAEHSDLFNTGIVVHTAAGLSMLFATLGCMISDESALKQAWQMKGASGTMLCLCCRNVVAHTSKLHQTDVTGFMVPSTETDTRRWVLHTDATVREAIEFLGRRQPVMGKTAFNQLQTSIGFNLCPTGLISSVKLAQIVRPISNTMFDWMHTYVVSGIFHLEVGLLLQRLSWIGVCHTDVHNFVNRFKWPARLSCKSANGINTFEKRAQGAGEMLKCSASESLSIFRVLRLYLMIEICPNAGNELKQACDSYFKLCTVICHLMNVPKGDVTAQELGHAILTHLNAFKAVYGDEAWIPKCHYALHLPAMLQRHGFLMSCWVHERKHKELKRFANELDNTSASYERSILEDVLHGQLETLADRAAWPTTDGAQLVKPRRASQAIGTLIQNEFQTTGVVFAANEAVYAPMQRCSKSDVAVVVLDGKCHVAEIWFHVEVDGVCITCVSPWGNLGNNRFKIESNPVFIRTSRIKETCVHCRMGSNAIVVP